MTLFFVIFCIYLLHIHFLLQNIYLGLDEVEIFGFPFVYQFNTSVAQESLLFSTFCLLAFVLGYILSYRRRPNLQNQVPLSTSIIGCRNELRWLNFFGVVVILYMLILIVITGGSYGSMVKIRASSGFIFELRMLYLLLLTHVMLNVPIGQFLSDRAFRLARLVLVLYVVAVVIFQARSCLFEIAGVLLIPRLLWNGDKIKFKYLLYLGIAMFVPNLVVLGRIGIQDDFWSTASLVFSFEYTMVLSKFLGAAISNPVSMDTTSFLTHFQLLLPSPLRNLFDLPPIQYGFFNKISETAGVTGGGFSLLAQLYNDFRWYSPIVLLIIGYVIGRVVGRGRRVGRVSIKYSYGPLLYCGFILAIRNDFGVLLKYSVQLVVISWVLNFLVRTRLGKTSQLIFPTTVKHQ